LTDQGIQESPQKAKGLAASEPKHERQCPKFGTLRKTV